MSGLSRKQRTLRGLHREPVDRLPTQTNYSITVGKPLSSHFGAPVFALSGPLDNYSLRVDIAHPQRTNLDGTIRLDRWLASGGTGTEGYWQPFASIEGTADLALEAEEVSFQ